MKALAPEITSLLPGAKAFDDGANLGPPPEPAIPRLPLLCASREGYQNLCRLITRTKLRAPKYPVALTRRTKPAEDIVLHSQAVRIGGRS